MDVHDLMASLIGDEDRVPRERIDEWVELPIRYPRKFEIDFIVVV